MGQQINPKAIRIVDKTKTGRAMRLVDKGIKGGFANNWYSDYKYSTFFYQDFFIKKNIIRILMKYYKTRIRFLKGRRRRLKSILRMSRFNCLRSPYKMILLCCIYRPATMGLQRKHTAFIYQIKKSSASRDTREEQRVSYKKLDTERRSRRLAESIFLWGRPHSFISSNYFKKFKKLAALMWLRSLKEELAPYF